MIDVYTTKQGDTFESVAFLLYGDEKYMKELIEANWDKADVLVFDSGTELIAPDIYEDAEDGLPFWREDDDEDEYDDDEAYEDEYYEYDEDPDDEDLTDIEADSEDPDISDEEDEDDE